MTTAVKGTFSLVDVKDGTHIVKSSAGEIGVALKEGTVEKLVNLVTSMTNNTNINDDDKISKFADNIQKIVNGATPKFGTDDIDGNVFTDDIWVTKASVKGGRSRRLKRRRGRKSRRSRR
jgi:hypothetical protein